MVYTCDSCSSALTHYTRVGFLMIKGIYSVKSEIDKCINLDQEYRC